jgi:spore coat protein U-like protein
VPLDLDARKPVSAAMRAALPAMLLLAATAVRAAPACTVSIVPVAFGAYSPLSGASRESVGSVGVSCSDAVSSSVSYSIALSAGTGTYASRLMASAGYSLTYNLFTDSGRSLIWGDGAGGSSVVGDSYTIATSPTLRAYPVYGRIPGGQTQAHQGTYADSITVTVTF